jgi:hypothetical protein
MVNITGNYKLTGSYLLNGIKGLQTGKVYCFPDGKVVGSVSDDNKSSNVTVSVKKEGIMVGLPGGHAQDCKKLVLGYISPKLRFMFFKLPPLNYPNYAMVSDIIWALEGKKDGRNLNFSGAYDMLGKGGTEISCFFISGLEAILKSPDDESFKRLIENTPTDIFMEQLFKKDIYDLVISEAEQNETLGELVLEKI